MSYASANDCIPPLPPAASHPTLDDMMVFQLYKAWSGANPIFTRLCEGRFNITRREWRILATVAQQGCLTSAAVARAAGLDPARTSRAISSLCEKGWLTRRRDEHDARVVFIVQTDSGRSLYKEIMPAVTELNAVLTQDLDAEEVAALRGMLGKIARRAAMMLEADLVKERPHRGSAAKRRLA